MRINALRRELRALLDAAAVSRPPVLRRSRRQEWLYATDLPALSGGTLPESLASGLRQAGWEFFPDGSWLQLRKDSAEPPRDGFDGPFGPEAECCLSLLRRHPGGPEAEGIPARRRLIKAGEEGAEAYEKTCAALHREWAERLRRGQPLPGISPLYFQNGKE